MTLWEVILIQDIWKVTGVDTIGPAMPVYNVEAWDKSFPGKEEKGHGVKDSYSSHKSGTSPCCLLTYNSSTDSTAIQSLRLEHGTGRCS